MKTLVLIFRLFTADGEFFTENTLPPSATVKVCVELAQRTVPLVADRFDADRVTWTCEIRPIALT